MSNRRIRRPTSLGEYPQSGGRSRPTRTSAESPGKAKRHSDGTERLGVLWGPAVAGGRNTGADGGGGCVFDNCELRRAPLSRHRDVSQRTCA